MVIYIAVSEPHTNCQITEKKIMLLKSTMLLFALSLSFALSAENFKLPPPQREGGTGLFTVLDQRRSKRSYRTEPLTRQELSTLLWAGFGVTRANGRRTAPSAVNRQEFTLYALLEDGAYKYLPATNELEKVSDGDLRHLAAGNVTAPAYILLVADLQRAASPEYAAIDAGYISQNLYLAATALELGSCALGSFRRDEAGLAKLKAELKLAESEKPILSQAVGKTK